MTTTSWASRIRNDSDAAYREWRDELVTQLGLLVAGGNLAADETNITPGAGSRPATNTEGGYAVYHLSDSLHGTAPVYIRFGFGSGASNMPPRLQVTVGTTTNGSGVLGGTALSAIASCGTVSNVAYTSDTTRNSYACALPGYLGLAHKLGSLAGTLIVCRTCDSAGSPTVTGLCLYIGAGVSTTLSKVQAFRYAATAAAYTANTSLSNAQFCSNPQGQSTAVVGSNYQVFLCWTITPQVAPVFGVCGVLSGDVGSETAFSVALVGSTARTYLSLTSGMPVGVGAADATNPYGAMLYE